MSAGDRIVDFSTLESWFWETAHVVREGDAPKMLKDILLPYLFLKRLLEVFDDDVDCLARDVGSKRKAAKLVEDDHTLVLFYIPPEARWPALSRVRGGISRVRDALYSIARENPRLQGLVDVATSQLPRPASAPLAGEPFSALVQVLGIRTVTIESPFGPIEITFGLAAQADGEPYIELEHQWMLKASDRQYEWAKAHRADIVNAIVDAVMEEWARRRSSFRGGGP